jgi:hypothetical protein
LPDPPAVVNPTCLFLSGFCHGIFLRNGLVHKGLIVVRLIKIKPLIKVSV